MSDSIVKFEGEHAFLSNFWVEPFDCGGQIVQSAEHAFQAQKATNRTEQQLVLSAQYPDGRPHPGHAKRLGRRVKIREDWQDVKVAVMRSILRYKFAPGSPLAEKLLATGDATLIEGNHWGDLFWGCVVDDEGEWTGRNELGRLLMEVRNELR